MYIAEGSDWFWWYGDDHSSALDALFDHLFRKHLRNVYALLRAEPPGLLFAAISRSSQGRKALHDQPNSFLNVSVDGRSSYFEWINAAKYVCGNDRGTMTLVSQGPLRSVWFGFSVEKLYLRVDCDGPARRAPGRGRLRAGRIRRPRRLGDHRLRSRLAPPLGPPAPRRRGDGRPGSVEVATDKILELAVPFASLGQGEGDPLRFYVELLKGDASLDRAPREGIFELSVPTPDFERIMWQV